MGRYERREVAVDRERVARLVGQKVTVGLDNGEQRSVGIAAALEEVRDDGIVLSDIGELGPGPTMFCPWDSLKRYSEWVPWLRPPGEDAREYYDLYEWREPLAEEVVLELPQGCQPSARRLERVVSIAQRQTVGEVTVALASLELFGKGLGVLRYRISCGEVTFEGSYGIPDPSWSSGMSSTANFPGHRGALAPATAKQPARWRFESCRRRGNSRWR
jgi:hypothetical protein